MSEREAPEVTKAAIHYQEHKQVAKNYYNQKQTEINSAQAVLTAERDRLRGISSPAVQKMVQLQKIADTEHEFAVRSQGTIDFQADYAREHAAEHTEALVADAIKGAEAAGHKIDY